MAPAFLRDVLLPAVRANTGLRKLAAAHDDDAAPHLALLLEAERVVAQRGR